MLSILTINGGSSSIRFAVYDHDLTEPVIHAWNGRPTVVAVAQ